MFGVADSTRKSPCCKRSVQGHDRILYSVAGAKGGGVRSLSFSFLSLGLLNGWFVKHDFGRSLSAHL